MKLALVVACAIAASGCAGRPATPEPVEVPAAARERIAEVRILQAPAGAVEGTPVGVVSELRVGEPAEILVRLRGFAGGPGSLVVEGVRVVFSLRSAAGDEMARSEWIQGESGRSSIGADGDLLLGYPWRVPDDGWDLAESLSIRDLQLHAGARQLDHAGGDVHRLVYPAPHPGLAPLLGVWVGGESWAEDARIIDFDETGEVTRVTDKVLATVTLIASRARPAGPFLQVLVMPGWNITHRGLLLDGTRIVDFSTDTELGTLDETGLRARLPIVGSRGHWFHLELRPRGQDDAGREALGLEIQELAPVAGGPPRMLRRLEASLYLKSR